LDTDPTFGVFFMAKENEYLRAEVAYLKKLDALLKEKARAAQRKKRK
jgi:transposase